MNKIYKIAALLGLASSLSLTSCNKFLDVQPTGTLIEDVQFSDEQGYYDALYGVYGKMASENLYGEALSYGFLDKIGQQFCYNIAVNVDNRIVQFQYKDQDVRKLVDAIWVNQYEAISYVNNILKHLEKEDLSQGNFKWVKGEALALRAYLHFDVLRLFADRYPGNENARGIPYAYTFDLNNKQLFNLKDSYANVIKDLTDAELLLSEDKVVKTEDTFSTDFTQGRIAHMNLYAVKALLARVYYTMGNATEAAKYAAEVIEAKHNFSLVKSSKFEEVRRFPASPELIFGLHNTQLSKGIASLFINRELSSGTFTEARKDLSDLYETKKFSASNTDVRYKSFYVDNSEQLTFSFVRFIKDEAEINEQSKQLKGICMIRLPEMYYILSESIYDTDKAKAIETLNEVRASRGLEAIDETTIASKEAFQTEMSHERMREFPGEGQIFYGLKYYNQEFVAWDKEMVKPSADIFVLPWPEAELEFGNK